MKNPGDAGWTNFYFAKNLQGDVMAVYRSDYDYSTSTYYGTLVAKYTYDPYGQVLTMVNGEGTDVSGNANSYARINPFRYRGYYQDNESGFYYLQSRYYDPEICRFINADNTDVLGVNQESLLQFNLFAYCLNDPINRSDTNGNLSLPNWAKIAIGVVAIAVGVVATAATGGAAGVVFAASVKIAIGSAVTGAVTSAATTAISTAISGGSAKDVLRSSLSSAVDGFCDGFMWGGITAGATFTTAAAKRVKIQEIGRLKPTNKPGDGYPGVKYKNKRGGIRSLELHSPHASGPHNRWHWQKNVWSEYNGISTISSKKAIHWTIWGSRL